MPQITGLPLWSWCPASRMCKLLPFYLQVKAPTQRRFDLPHALLLVGSYLPLWAPDFFWDPSHCNGKQAKIKKNGRKVALAQCLTFGKLLNCSKIKTLSYNPRRLQTYGWNRGQGCPLRRMSQESELLRETRETRGSSLHLRNSQWPTH